MFPGGELRFTSLTVFTFMNLFSVADLKKQSIVTKVLNKPDHCQAKAEYGDTVFIHYSAWLESGEMVDSSLNKGPMMLELGGNRIIKGLDMGIRGMCVGEKLSLVIPPEYAYGERGYPPYIPPDATLTFHVELVSIKSVAAEEAVFRMLRFLVAPVAAICIVMYLYKKYQKFPTKKELKGFKKNKKKN